MSDEFRFHVGYYDHLHPAPSVNFQMNRWINYLGPSALADMEAIAPQLTEFRSYGAQFLALADQALAQGRNLHAAYYYRSAEFFMSGDDPAKRPTRDKFRRLLLDHYRIGDDMCQQVRFRDGAVEGLLPAYHFQAPHARGTIVVHGGFDSYIEEFFPVLLQVSRAGYDLIAFEGPGQGGALLDGGLRLTHEWHKPLAAVLDHFSAKDVTLLGISMGGCLALRAAAFEPRVQRAIAYDVFYDWPDTTLTKLEGVGTVLRLLLRLRAAGPFNAILAAIEKRSLLFQWAMRQAMDVLQVATSYEVFRASEPYTTRDVSPLLLQDVLVMAGAEDHIIPLQHYYRQVEALTAARSVTPRLFTRAEGAQNHCQVGNLGLAVQVITDWIGAASSGQLPSQSTR